MESQPDLNLPFSEFQKQINDLYKKYKWEPKQLENGCENQKNDKKIIKLTPTQQFLTNYFTPKLNTKGLLIWHSVGSGKTCSAISVASNSFEYDYKILWVTRRTIKDDIWKNMFDNICSITVRKMIETGIILPKDRDKQIQLLRTKTKSWLMPITYRQFSNIFAGNNEIKQYLIKINGIDDPIRKTLIIIDEAHKLYGSDLITVERPNTKAIEKGIFNSYKKSGENSVKVILMTATPITNSPIEAFQLLNLLIEKESDRFPTEPKSFLKTFLNSDKTDLSTSGIKLFQKNAKGLISYLDQSNDPNFFVNKMFHDIIKMPISRINRDFKKEKEEVLANIKQLKANACKNISNKIETFKKDFVVENNLDECQKKFENDMDEIRNQLQIEVKKCKDPLCVNAKNRFEECKKLNMEIKKKEVKQKKDVLENLEEREKKCKEKMKKIIEKKVKDFNESFKELDIMQKYVQVIPLKECIEQEIGGKRKANCIRKVANWSKLTKQHRFDKDNFDPEIIKKYLKKLSPKMVALFENIKRLDDKDFKKDGKVYKHFIYSDVKDGGYGAKVLASAFIAMGFNLVMKKGKGVHGGKAIVLDLSERKRNNFAVLSSTDLFDTQITKHFTKQLIDTFNKRSDNIYGDNIRFIILDSGYKEGIDLYDVKYCHIFEPQLTEADLTQAIGRGTRYCGQKGLQFVPNIGWQLHIYQYELTFKNENIGDIVSHYHYQNYSDFNLKLIKIQNKIKNLIIKTAVDYELNLNVHK